MENTEDLIVVSNTEVSYQQDRALIDSQVATAKAYPRDIKRATTNSIAVVTMDMESASSCTYSVPRSGKAITGPSVHMARIIVQQWGNIRAESRVVDITDKHVVSQAVCYDLETNFAVKVEVRRSILTKKGRMNDDMITVTGNAANAIAYRNAVFAVIPKSIIDKVYKSAIGLITGDVSDETKLIKRRNQVFEGLKKAYGVSDEEILSSVGKSKIEYVGVEELTVLIGIGTAIKEGDTTVEQAFRASEVKSSKAIAQKAEEERLIKFMDECQDIEVLKGIYAEVQSETEKASYDKNFDRLSK